MLNVGVVGATGYTGLELVRLLLGHVDVNLTVVTSDAEQGKRIDSIFPALRNRCDLEFAAHDSPQLASCDFVFFATPHATSMSRIPALLDEGCRVIDLSADFRIKDAAVWQDWYGIEHACPERLDKAVYGLPELYREDIKSASLVANPGCYPTAVALGLLPALVNGLINSDNIIVDAKSGVSGAGRKAAVASLHAEVSESFKAYGVSGHRHLPEILQTLRAASDDSSLNLTFVPHLLPMNRGILATIYVESVKHGAGFQEAYVDFFKTEPFVDVLPAASHPETRVVRGTNQCQIAIHDNIKESRNIVIISTIDNLVKGAAGQAIQNMNLMAGFAETSGLSALGLVP